MARPKAAPDVTLVCVQCSVTFTIPHYRYRNGERQFCSKRCSLNAQLPKIRPKQIAAVTGRHPANFANCRVVCGGCGKEFLTRPSQKAKFCSRACADADKRLHPFFAKPLDKHARQIDDKGYVRVTIGRRYVREHRRIMALAIGRALRPDEDIHHLNNVKTDNRLENLCILSHEDHGILSLSRTRKFRRLHPNVTFAVVRNPNGETAYHFHVIRVDV